MERLVLRLRLGILNLWWQCRHVARRSCRGLGVDGLLVLAGLLLVCGLVAGVAYVREEQAAVRDLGSMAEAVPLPLPAAVEVSNLEKFERILPAHDDIPELLGDLFELAGEEKLALSRGEYRAQNDDIGQFTRYRMNLPVKGDAAAVQRFIERALAGNRSLVFESVQFKRDRIQTEQIEAQVQWTLVTGLPGRAARELAGAAL
ncbi:MAG: hypothetical protein FWF12_07675 [Betaproteobacteria bacterium]|nr:hypothetical protein [Betaproteobacteria bacterium]